MHVPESIPVFRRLLPRVFDYADQTDVAHEHFEEYFAREDEWAEYPEGWQGNVLGMLAGSAVCGTRARTDRFLADEGRALEDDERVLAEEWRRVPWTYAVLAECVRRTPESADAADSDLLDGIPVGDPPQGWPEDPGWERLTIYSPTLAQRVAQGRTTAIALLWYDGELFHTYGVILSFQNFGAADLLFFADVVRGEREAAQRRGVVPLLGVVGRTTAVSTLIRREPLPFLHLYSYQYAPPPHGAGGSWYRCASVARWNDVAPLTEGKFWWDALTRAGYPPQVADMYPDAGAILLGTGSFMEEPRIYLSTASNHVILAAMTDAAYQRGVDALVQLVELPSSPQCRASIIMYRAALEITDFEDEIEVFDGLFDDVLASPEEPND
ncbi:MAG: hypothetical protein WD492_05040 [Alkalispirochaeta sp.]